MPSTNTRRILTGIKPSLRKTRKNGKGSKGGVVPMFLHMLNTVKLYHWKTSSYATHKATDDLYGSLNEKIDHFVEVMLGKKEMGERSKILNVHSLNLSLYSSNNEFKKEVERYKSFLINLSNDPKFNSLMNVDLIAIRDEILADLNKFLYLLTLK